MGLLLSPSQREHFERGRQLYLSNDARKLRSDPEISEAQELAALSHFLKSWKTIEPRYGKKDVVITGANGEVIRKGKNELPGLGLVPDNEVYLDPAESKQFQIDETARFKLDGEVKEAYSSMTSEEKDWFIGIINKHIDGGSIDKVGELGTTGRTYPTDYADPALRGQAIPAIFAPGQKRDRGIGLMIDGVQQIDPDLGSGTFGQSKDALHRHAAANAPELLTDPENIRLGNASLNQSVKAFEGEALKSALNKRSNRLNDEYFELENEVKAAPADKGDISKKDSALYLKTLNALLEDVPQDAAGDLVTAYKRRTLGLE